MLAQYNLTPANLQTQVQSALQGNVIGSLFEKEQQSPIRMVYPGNRSLDVSSLKKLTVFLPNGKPLPISQLANVELRTGDAEVQRENLQAMGVISARLDSLDLGSVMPAIKKNISAINLPTGYHVEYGGAYAEQQQSFKELLIILITSSLLVFGVILFLFKQFRIALAHPGGSGIGYWRQFPGIMANPNSIKRGQLYRSDHDRGYHWRKRHFYLLAVQGKHQT
jgi:Cu/Ag efflux pump CusA